MVVNIRVPFWVLTIIRHPIFRVPKKGTLILMGSIGVCRIFRAWGLDFEFRAFRTLGEVVKVFRVSIAGLAEGHRSVVDKPREPNTP